MRALAQAETVGRQHLLTRKLEGDEQVVELSEQIVRHILEQCPARTDEALRDRFGISYNTLLKIERGEPIRRSLAVRLEERLQAEISH